MRQTIEDISICDVCGGKIHGFNQLYAGKPATDRSSHHDDGLRTLGKADVCSSCWSKVPGKDNEEKSKNLINFLVKVLGAMFALGIKMEKK